MKRFLAAGLLVFLVVLASEARAQTGTARGKVLDEKGEAVADAKIEIDYLGGVSRKFETKTSKKGEFTQVGLQGGVYRFTVTKEGYQGTFLEAKISIGDPVYLPDLKITTRSAAAGGATDKALVELKAAVDKAIELAKGGKLDEAEALYKETLAKNPTVPQLHHNLGMIYLLKKDNASAEAAFLKAIEVKPEFAEAYVVLSNLYLSGNQMAKAAELVSKAAAAYPQEAKLQVQLGYVYFNQGKSDEAAEFFKKAEALDPANPEPQYYLGSIALSLGKTDECIARLEKYLSMSPQNQQNVATAQGLIAALKPKK